MRIEKETEVTIKVKIGYVWPDDFKDKFGNNYIRENTFRSQPMIENATEAEEVLANLYANLYDLFQASEVTVRDLGIVQE